MQITERRVGQAIILDLVGELTYANRSTFKGAVERSKQAGCRHLILNMEGVRFLDSSALGMLVLLVQSMKTCASRSKRAKTAKLCQRDHHAGEPASLVAGLQYGTGRARGRAASSRRVIGA